MILDTLLAKGSLTKMTITALEADPAPDSPPVRSSNPDDTLTVLVNPNTYRINYALNYNRQPPQGASSTSAQYVSSEPISIDFELLFDGTGVIPKMPSNNPLEGVPVAGAIAGAIASLTGGDEEEYDVAKQILKLNNIVYTYEGEQHQPRKVQICWGKLVFFGALKSLSYQFKLFKSDGTPLRATANVSFENHRNDFLREAVQQTASPDLTHRRTVQEGDTLPLMCYRIYGDSSLYLQVAEANKLLNFRALTVGQELFFPPVDNFKK
ncbi:hypothetical protein HNV11_06880 [Spirosoma taeanense]|uniref:LysM domain-containing protein n=1 Tax=Spirosoma taeanense TaxID=2735870 RepID=A0A6M5Y6N4_9BACT|nr:hypothetical protein [Spirosoma taeanense]QJW89134.1 hypothetical protein HNV11_06880 [Spirosoma taeanense]